MKFLAAVLLGLVLASLVFARQPVLGQYRAVQESLRTVPPKMRMEWLHEHAEGRRTEDGRPRTMSDSGSGLRLVGKWGRGPAAEVTGKDTLVVLTLGSEVALLNFAQPDSPRVLSEIQFPSLTAQSYLEDSLLYTSSNADLEIWSIANPTQPVKRGQLLGAVGDFWIRDTFLFYIRSDTFHVLSIANPANLHELGFCIEAGSVTTGSGNTVVVCQSGGFAFVDVSNPASPHQVGTYACGRTLTATARGSLVCASYAETGEPYTPHFITLDISTPSAPQLLANRSNLGGYDIFLDGPLAFVSGDGDVGLPFQIFSIADSAHPAFIDSCRTTNRYPYGVWESASLNRALVADECDGLAIVDVSNLNNPVLDTWALSAGWAMDVHVDGQHCYVADFLSGLRLLDLSDPTRPICISGLDTVMVDEVCNTATARDSFVFMGWWPSPYLRVVSVADPRHPEIVAGCSVEGFPQHVILRDSFIYVAMDYGFQVVNVARPRAPVVVGECGLPDMTEGYGMVILDTLAFVSTGVSGLQVVNIARADSPAIIGTLTPPSGACGVAVIDTFAYIVSGNLCVASVANPGSPYLIDSVVLPTFGWSVTATDSLLFVGSNGHIYGHPGNDIRLLDIRNPVRPVLIGSLEAPDAVTRLDWVESHLYAACYDAGVLVAETAAVGIQEVKSAATLRRELRVMPNPAVGLARIWFGEALNGESVLRIYDVSGRRMLEKSISKETVSTELNLGRLSSGLYFMRVETKNGVLESKLLKQ
ncbi:MAG TPA: T9SS type A sorting domain-containing protein [bacterium]|nr:T9SS type A sorting domain-containing protein [bacterium]